MNFKPHGSKQNLYSFRTLALRKWGRWNFRQAGLFVINPVEMGLEPVERGFCVLVLRNLGELGNSSRGKRNCGACRHAKKNNGNGGAIHEELQGAIAHQGRATPAQSV